MSPFGPLDAKEEDQSEAERRAVARRFRARKTERLHDLVRPLIGAEPIEVGEFSTRPLEAMAAVPVVGAFLALGTRFQHGSDGLTREVIVALDEENAHLLKKREEVTGSRAELVWSRPRKDLHVVSVAPKFMRERVDVEIAGEDKPLVLYATPLTTNPWAAGVVRALGGKAPEPRDLGSDDDEE